MIETVTCPRCGNDVRVHVQRSGAWIESRPCWCPLTREEINIIKQAGRDSAVLDGRFNPPVFAR